MHSVRFSSFLLLNWYTRDYLCQCKFQFFKKMVFLRRNVFFSIIIFFFFFCLVALIHYLCARNNLHFSLNSNIIWCFYSKLHSVWNLMGWHIVSEHLLFVVRGFHIDRFVVRRINLYLWLEIAVHTVHRNAVIRRCIFPACKMLFANNGKFILYIANCNWNCNSYQTERHYLKNKNRTEPIRTKSNANHSQIKICSVLHFRI